MYSITVLIVTYKQEDLIGRAIESVLKQKEWGLKNIIVQDDCSPDNNWDVIQDYQNKHPEYIISFRNDKNLGIYGNYNSLIAKRGDADLFYILEGDDAICDGWFKKIQEYLQNCSFNMKDQAIAVFSDYKIVRPNGMSINATNQKLVTKKGVSHVSLKSRGILSGRSTLASAKVYDRYTPVDLSQGLGVAEEMCDIQLFQNTDVFLYVPFIATIYYTHVGVSTQLNSENDIRERLAQFEWLKSLPVDKKALYFQDFRIAQCKYMLRPNWKNFQIMFSAYIKSFDRYTLKGEQKYIQVLIWVRMVKLLFKH